MSTNDQSKSTRLSPSNRAQREAIDRQCPIKKLNLLFSKEKQERQKLKMACWQSDVVFLQKENGSFFYLKNDWAHFVVSSFLFSLV